MLAFIVTPKSFSFTVYTADFVGRHRVASQRPLTAVTGLATNQCVGRIGTWANLARSWPRFLKERPISEVHHRLCDPIACMYSVHAWCSCIHSMFSVHASTNIIYCASSTTTDRLMCHELFPCKDSCLAHTHQHVHRTFYIVMLFFHDKRVVHMCMYWCTLSTLLALYSLHVFSTCKYQPTSVHSVRQPIDWCSMNCFHASIHVHTHHHVHCWLCICFLTYYYCCLCLAYTPRWE